MTVVDRPASVVPEGPAMPSLPLVSPEEYLRRERDAPFKSEYIEGRILPMSGGTPVHVRIGTDICAELVVWSRASSGECEAFSSDMKVRVSEGGPYFYPDASVSCGQAEFDADGCLRNPIAIFEVLSESTKAFDRDEKFRYYRRIPSLRHYVLVASDTIRVEHYERLPGNIWALVGEFETADDVLTFGEPALSILVSSMYQRFRPQNDQGLASAEDRAE